jgi:hypothetical protein
VIVDYNEPPFGILGTPTDEARWLCDPLLAGLSSTRTQAFWPKLSIAAKITTVGTSFFYSRKCVE